MDRAKTLVVLERMRARICFGLLPFIFLPPLITQRSFPPSGKITHVEQTSLKIDSHFIPAQAAHRTEGANVFI
jgi:hypothetical protein